MLLSLCSATRHMAAQDTLAEQQDRKSEETLRAAEQQDRKSEFQPELCNKVVLDKDRTVSTTLKDPNLQDACKSSKSSKSSTVEKSHKFCQELPALQDPHQRICHSATASGLWQIVQLHRSLKEICLRTLVGQAVCLQVTRAELGRRW